MASRMKLQQNLRASLIAFRSQSRLSGVLVVVLCFMNAALADSTPVEDVLAKLQSDSFTERVVAQRELTDLAAGHLELLEQAAFNVDAEVARRIVTALESVFLKHDGDLGEQAERALQRLARSGTTTSVQAGQVLHGNARIRESRARVELEKLGAQFVYYSPLAQSNGQILFGMKAAVLPEVGVEFGPAAVLHSIYIHEDWKGTAADLWHFTRLAHHRDLTIYSIKGNSVDINDLFVLASELRGLAVQERGACLGIVSAPFGGLCRVGLVVKNSAADKGEIEAGDEIIGLDEGDIRSFPHLVQTLQDYKIGDEVTFTVIRDGEILKKVVKLGSWRDIAFNNELVVPPPPLFGGPFDQPAPNQEATAPPANDLTETKKDADAPAPASPKDE